MKNTLINLDNLFTKVRTDPNEIKVNEEYYFHSLAINEHLIKNQNIEIIKDDISILRKFMTWGTLLFFIFPVHLGFCKNFRLLLPLDWIFMVKKKKKN